MKLPILPPAVNQKRLKDGETQQALDNIVTPANVVLTFLRSIFTYVANTLALTVDTLTVNLSATFAKLSATNATITNLTTTTETVGTLAVTGNETVGGTLGVTGSITGAGYSGGPISGTTLNTSGLATLNSANVTGNSTVGSSTVTGNETVGGTLAVTGASTSMRQLTLLQPTGSISDWNLYEDSNKNLAVSGGTNNCFFTAAAFVTQQATNGAVALRASNYNSGTAVSANLQLETGNRHWGIVSDGNGNLAFNDNTVNLNRGFFDTSGVLHLSQGLTSTGPLTSSTGFKAIVGPFTWWVGGNSNTGGVMRYTVYDNVATTGVFALNFIAPFAGSLLAVSANLNASLTQDTVIQANIAGTGVITGNIPAGSFNITATAAKGAHTFTAGQALSVNIGWAGAQTYAVCSAFIAIEMAA